MKHRIINTKFWHDEYVQNLSIQKRYLYLYLFTNPHTEISGIYEISLKTMEFETLIDSDSLSQSLKEFENDKKLLYQDNWIILKNFVKHQRPNPSILQGVKNAISELPKEIYQKAQRIGIFTDSLSQSVDSLSHTPLYKVKESKVNKDIIEISKIQTIVEKWNSCNVYLGNCRNISARRKLLPQCLKITPVIDKSFEKLKEYSFEDFKKAIEKYAQEIINRDPANDYANHRFSFYEFFTQKNGFIKFLNR